MDPENIPVDDKEFIIEKAIDGWSADLIAHELRKNNELGGGLREETVKQFLDSERAQEEIEVEKRIQEKKAEVSREDLIRELSDQISILRERSDHLRNTKNDEIGNDTTRNLLKAVRDLADLIDVLEDKDSGSADNVVNINRLEQSFDITQSVQYLPSSDKRDILEKLEGDESVEDYMVVKKDA